MKVTLLNLLILCSVSMGALAQDHSVARQWNELLLEAIRSDLARPTVHARNLFHHSVAMYDAWAFYDTEARLYFLGKTHGDYTVPFQAFSFDGDVQAAREEAISYASYRLIRHRFSWSPGADEILPMTDSLMVQLGYDIENTSLAYEDHSPAALGNYLASQLIAFGLQDGSNEQEDYANLYYEPVNGSLVPRQTGTDSIVDPNRWQPLRLETFIDQSGNVISTQQPPFLSPEWGWVTPFSLQPEEATDKERDGHTYRVFHDPGSPALLDTTANNASTQFYRWNHQLVTIWSSHLNPEDTTRLDISPAALGNIPLESLPDTPEEFMAFYDLLEGGDPGQGYDINPATQLPYQSQWVRRGDYARILAEFWADGPDSETPPGHWFTILNHVNDHPLLDKQLEGMGPILDPLEWDVKAYFILGGAMHDAAITAWSIKGYYDYIRPISALRYMASLGQSTDSTLSNYHPAGVSLVPGYIEVIEQGDPLQGFSGEHIGKIKFKAWLGHKAIPQPENFYAGVDWILAGDWNPYQRQTFVTPPFAGYVSGHSTYSRAAAEVLTRLTGSAYFPGGMGVFPAYKNEFLVFEDGPSEYVELQWATYQDASDQCSLSRIWGGIHPPIDDIPGRKIGYVIGHEAFAYGKQFFEGRQDQLLNVGGEAISGLVYPNPASDRITLQTTLSGTWQVISLEGKVFTVPLTKNEGSKVTLDTSGLQPGIYILQSTAGDQQWKFRKE